MTLGIPIITTELIFSPKILLHLQSGGNEVPE